MKIIQSEWVFEDTLRAAVYLHCMAKIDDSTSQVEFDECAGGTQATALVSKESQIELSMNSFNKGSSYNYASLDLAFFNGMTEFVNVCDQRLFGLINEEKYKSLTAGTDWKYQRWIVKRNKMRQALVSLNLP